jgi:hypothetical protein
MKTTRIFLALASGLFAGTPVPDQSPVDRPTEPSIVKQSMILHDGPNWTMIPTGAVIHLPEVWREKLDAKPVGKLLPWSDFLARNGSWITTSEVTFDQAAGNDPLPAKPAAALANQAKIVIAVLKNGPSAVHVGPDLDAISQR